MNYELALELKAAGFPQKKKEWNCQYCPEAFGEFPDQPEVYKPTLSELIEAVRKINYGLNQFSLYGRSSDRWEATAVGVSMRTLESDFIEESGSTPEEAVARLWLKLNKSDE